MPGDAHNNHVAKVEKVKLTQSICPRHLKFLLELHTNDPKLPLRFQAEEIIISVDILKNLKNHNNHDRFLDGKVC